MGREAAEARVGGGSCQLVNLMPCNICESNECGLPHKLHAWYPTPPLRRLAPATPPPSASANGTLSTVIVEMTSDTEKSKRNSQESDNEDQAALKQQVQKLEVACAELKGLPPSRSVYLKRGAVFFRSDVKTLTNLQQNMLEKAKAGSRNSETVKQ